MLPLAFPKQKHDTYSQLFAILQLHCLVASKKWSLVIQPKPKGYRKQGAA